MAETTLSVKGHLSILDCCSAMAENLLAGVVAPTAGRCVAVAGLKCAAMEILAAGSFQPRAVVNMLRDAQVCGRGNTSICTGQRADFFVCGGIGLC